MRAIVIISYTGKYGWHNIINCYHSIRNHNKNILIILVNNFNETIHPTLNLDTNFRYFTNEENIYELGAIQTAVYNNDDVDNFCIVHDSCILLSDISNFSDTQEIIFFKTTIMDVAPVLHHVKKWCECYFPEILYNDKKHYICQGLMGYFPKKLLMATFDYGLKNIKVSTKEQAVASEAMFGMVLEKLSSNITIYYDHKLDDYITLKYPWKFLKKLSGGKCANPITYFPLFIPTSSEAHPSQLYVFNYDTMYYPSLNTCIEKNLDKDTTDIILNYYNNNKSALNVITEQINKEYVIENDTYSIGNVLNINKHMLFVMKYFSLYKYQH